MFPEQQYVSDLANRARMGDAHALDRLHKEIDPHLERFIRRAMRVEEPRSELDRQLRSMARHANALARYQDGDAKPGIVKRVIRGIYGTLWNPQPAHPPTCVVPLKTMCC
jgi:hypothetical protein